MSFDALPHQNQRIAVIGGGVSGMAAAYALGGAHQVTLFESEPRLGGHARTVMAGLRGDQPVDTGFIVFNYINYPHLTRMFQDLDVPVVESDMSFGVTVDNGRVEYGLRDLQALTGQRRNLMRPRYLQMVRDIFRFNRDAESAARPGMNIDELSKALNLGPWFRNYYLMPICGAVWSTPTQNIGDFPAETLVRFFRNHALLGTRQHQWWTVKGGSIEYVIRLEAHLRALGVEMALGQPVQTVRRRGLESDVIVNGQVQTFDHVIFACHSDDAMRLLERPTAQEQQIIGSIAYQDNQVILHRDPAQMPKRKACWSSWVYKAEADRENPKIGVTYWMNRLQRIDPADPLFVTLNPSTPVREEMIYDQVTFRHPVFDQGAIDAQTRLMDLQGSNNTWFAGAYTRNGFHEDGFASGMRVARLLDRQHA